MLGAAAGSAATEPSKSNRCPFSRQFGDMIIGVLRKECRTGVVFREPTLPDDRKHTPNLSSPWTVDIRHLGKTIVACSLSLIRSFGPSGRPQTVCRQISAAFSSGALLPSCNSAVRASPLPILTMRCARR